MSVQNRRMDVKNISDSWLLYIKCIKLVFLIRIYSYVPSWLISVIQDGFLHIKSPFALLLGDIYMTSF